jgi:4'-phosphopantetheinyl transferase
VIQIYYLRLNKELTNVESAKLIEWVKGMIDSVKLSRFRKFSDRYAYLLGRCLLKVGLIELDYDVNNIRLITDMYGRPTIDEKLDFNISHSGDYVICAFNSTGRIGVDIELRQPLILSDFDQQFSDEEWRAISVSENALNTFFDFWTIKEAVIKADGRGLNLPLKSICIDLTSNTKQVNAGKKEWAVEKISINKNYSCHIASQQPNNNVRLQGILTEDILNKWVKS